MLVIDHDAGEAFGHQVFQVRKKLIVSLSAMGCVYHTPWSSFQINGLQTLHVLKESFQFAESGVLGIDIHSVRHKFVN